jgi:hypothetical protein
VNLFSPVSLEGCTKVSAQAIKSIASETVTTFNLSHCSFITDDVISSVTKNCPNIKSLVLNNCQGTTSSYFFILLPLILIFLGLTEESIRTISVNLPCIQNIQLAKFPKKWTAFPFLIEMKQLQSISLSEWNTLNNGNLESLGKLPCLQSLDVCL